MHRARASITMESMQPATQKPAMTTAAFHAFVGYARRLADGERCGRTDRELLDRFVLQRDEAAFAELVRRHGPMVLAACRRVLRHHEDAEDSFQATFLVLARKASSIRESASVGGWLHQVAFRLALRARVSAQRRRETLAPLHDVVVAPEPRRSEVSLSAFLDRELERLPDQYRSAVVLCYLEGRTQTEAARQLATTADAVNSRLKRARELLRRRLVRHGLALSSAALAEALPSAALWAALPSALVGSTVRAAVNFGTSPGSASGATALATALAKGALLNMCIAKTKLVSACALVLFLLAGAALLGTPANGDVSLNLAAQKSEVKPPAQAKAPPPPGKGKGKPHKSVIILWMNGGVSQLDTFDPKPAHANGKLSKAIDTRVKDLQISEHLPRLAKLANHLAIIRSLHHREGDHNRSTYLMRTGYDGDFGGAIEYPSLGCVLAKELGDGRPDLPRYISINPHVTRGHGPGFLGPQYAPLLCAGRGFAPKPIELPDVEAFEALAKGKGEKHRDAVAKAFDLDDEKAEVLDAYGHNEFGRSCLLARRLVERGVPVVELSMTGWDMHGNLLDTLPKRCAELDAGWASLLKDLHAGKRLEHTLIVFMSEFGRTPVINANAGRDHYPMSFSVVLAGAGIQGGQAIGKTSADGVSIEERPGKPPELYATIYRALGIDPTKKNRAAENINVPLVEKGAEAVKEALR